MLHFVLHIFREKGVFNYNETWSGHILAPAIEGIRIGGMKASVHLSGHVCQTSVHVHTVLVICFLHLTDLNDLILN